MDRADVSCVGACGDRHARIFEGLQILKSDLMNLLDPIERVAGLRQRGLDPVGQLILRNSRHVERSDHFRITPRFFFRREI